MRFQSQIQNSLLRMFSISYFLILGLFACQDQDDDPMLSAVQSNWQDFHQLNLKSDQINADVMITEVQMYNQSTISDPDDLFSSWIEITNLRYDAIQLKDWVIEIDGDSKKIKSKIKLLPQESTLIWVNAQKKGKNHLRFPQLNPDQSHLVKLISPKGETKSTVHVPQLDPDLSWALIFNQWQAAFPTPFLENSFWRKQTGVEYQIEFTTHLFTNRTPAIKLFQNFLLDYHPQDWETNIVARRLFDSASTQTQNSTNSQDLLPLEQFYLRYRVQLTDDDLVQLSWIDQSPQSRQRDLTLKFPNISPNFDRIAPQINGENGISYEHKRELNLYPQPKPQKLAYAIKAKEIEAVDVQDLEKLFYFFPDIWDRLGMSFSSNQLTFGDWRYDWQSCADIEIPHDTKICVKLSYLTLEDATLGKVEPLQVEVSWKSSQEDYLKHKVQEMNNVFLDVLGRRFVE